MHTIFWNTQNYRDVYDSLNNSFLKKWWFSEKQALSILEKHKKIQLGKIDQKIIEKNINIITYHDERYPKLLQEISNPPFLLYTRGIFSDKPALSVIGSRQISTYGKRITRKMVSELAKTFVIVSWWAYGCDSEAHSSCIQSWWETCVVVWTGIDVVYPIANKKLYEEVIATGWIIVSIFPIGTAGSPHNFPIRNEIISGLSLGTLVVEAAEKSWTLITAKLALEQWRDVFSIPWEIDKQNSIGCNLLIKRWEAKFVTHPQDIIEEYPFLKYAPQTIEVSLSEEQKNICDLLSIEPLNIDLIVQKTSHNLITVTKEITILEMKKILRKNSEWKYELI